MRTLVIFAFIAITLLFSCNEKKNEGEDQSKKNAQESIENNHLLMSVLFHQQSAEYEALCYQGFSIAKNMLEKNLNNQNITAKRAIITDVDETVLDNSPYQARCIDENISYPDKWDEWVKKAQAKPIPGAKEFLKYAANNNVEVFYVTNRKQHLKQATIENLAKEGLPFADSSHVITRTNESSKEKRRNKIEKEYHIVVLMGDNLADFTHVFDKKDIGKRHRLVDSLKTHFGKRFVVFPNCMYGDWVSAILDHNYNFSTGQQVQIFNDHLKSF
jgi:5'-nucleotidase (lipoprotein e(P4) family)